MKFSITNIQLRNGAGSLLGLAPDIEVELGVELDAIFDAVRAALGVDHDPSFSFAPVEEPAADLREPGEWGVRMIRQDGVGLTDLAHVCREWADRHAAYLTLALPGNPDMASVEVFRTGW